MLLLQELAEKSSFLEVAFLLIMGELPNKVRACVFVAVRIVASFVFFMILVVCPQAQLEQWTDKVMKHTYLHENAFDLMRTFRYDAHPMGMVVRCASSPLLLSSPKQKKYHVLVLFLLLLHLLLLFFFLSWWVAGACTRAAR